MFWPPRRPSTVVVLVLVVRYSAIALFFGPLKPCCQKHFATPLSGASRGRFQRLAYFSSPPSCATTTSFSMDFFYEFEAARFTNTAMEAIESRYVLSQPPIKVQCNDDVYLHTIKEGVKFLHPLYNKTQLPNKPTLNMKLLLRKSFRFTLQWAFFSLVWSGVLIMIAVMTSQPKSLVKRR